MNDQKQISIAELVQVIWYQKLKVIAITGFAIVISVLYALYLPNLYKSEVLLAPSAEKSFGSLADRIGGLAAVAGINLLNSSGIDRTTLTIELINSINFFDELDRKYKLKPLIMAAKNWNESSGELTFDPEIYDEKSEKWVRQVEFPKVSEPSLQETHRKFKEMVKVSQDEKTGVVKISVWHRSPTVAKTWADMLVTEVNDKVREMEVLEAEKSIEYLNNEIAKTSNTELKNSLYSLINEQYKKLTVANVKKEYALKTIDRAIVADDKDKPKRALIVIFFTLIGFLGSIFFALVSGRAEKS